MLYSRLQRGYSPKVGTQYCTTNKVQCPRVSSFHGLRMLQAGRVRQGGQQKREGTSKIWGQKEPELQSDCSVSCPAVALFPSTWLDCPSWGHLFVSKAPMGEGRDFWGTGGSLGQASQGVNLTGCGILALPKIDRVSRMEGGVLVKEVIRPEEEAHCVPHGHRVGDVFRVRDVQKASCHPGYQILAGERKQGW